MEGIEKKTESGTTEVEKTGWKIRDWCASVGISESLFYVLPERARPSSVKFGHRRIVTEQPAAWLQRMSEAEAAQ